MRTRFKRFAQVTLTALALMSPVLATADTVAATGTFTGASDHLTTGGVSVIKTNGGGVVVILGADFSLDGAPDPQVGFGKGGEYTTAANLGILGDLTGQQIFIVPASVNVDDFDEIYIWCEQFSVPLGVAALN